MFCQKFGQSIRFMLISEPEVAVLDHRCRQSFDPLRTQNERLATVLGLTHVTQVKILERKIKSDSNK